MAKRNHQKQWPCYLTGELSTEPHIRQSNALCRRESTTFKDGAVASLGAFAKTDMSTSFGIGYPQFPPFSTETQAPSKLSKSKYSEDLTATTTQATKQAGVNGWQKKEACRPCPHDVLVVRGKECGNHPGNVRFRKICWEFRQPYHDARRNEKREIAKKVYEIIVNQTPQGRFLRLAAGSAKHATPDSEYVVCDEEKIIVRITRILREQEKVVQRSVEELSKEEPQSLSNGSSNACSAQGPSEMPGPNLDTLFPGTVSVGTDSLSQRLHNDLYSDTVSSGNIGLPDRNDVVFGRGNCHMRFGNIQFRQFCWEIRVSYDKAKRLKEKRQLVLQVYERIKRLQPPGRFLIKVGGNYSTVFEEADESKVLEKIAQALRERKWSGPPPETLRY